MQIVNRCTKLSENFTLLMAGFVPVKMKLIREKALADAGEQEPKDRGGSD